MYVKIDFDQLSVIVVNFSVVLCDRPARFWENLYIMDFPTRFGAKYIMLSYNCNLNLGHHQ